jgi:hypothetical protein
MFREMEEYKAKVEAFEEEVTYYKWDKVSIIEFKAATIEAWEPMRTTRVRRYWRANP